MGSRRKIAAITDSGAKAAGKQNVGPGRRPESTEDMQYPDVKYVQLFKYADKKDKAMLFIALILSCAVGVGGPCVTLILRKSVNVLVSQKFKPFEASELQPQIKLFAIVGAILLVGAFAQTALIGIQSKRQL